MKTLSMLAAVIVLAVFFITPWPLYLGLGYVLMEATAGLFADDQDDGE